MKEQYEGAKEYIALTSKMRSVQQEMTELKEEMESLQQQVDKENQDVSKLIDGGLGSFFLKISGKYEDRMTKELLEAKAVSIKLEQKKQQFAELQRYLGELHISAQPYKNCEAEYKRLYEEKIEKLLEGESEEKLKIMDLYRKIEDATHNVKEIKEAINAGNQVKRGLSGVLESLEKAKSWGTYDMIGGGTVSSMVKHSHLDDARSKVEEVQRQLSRFHTELADVNLTSDLSIDTDGMIRFADIFFDNFFIDYSVQNRIRESIRNVENTSSKVSSILGKLELMKKKELIMMEETKKQIEQIVVESEMK